MASSAERDPSVGGESPRCFRPSTRRRAAMAISFAVVVGCALAGLVLGLPAWTGWGAGLLGVGLLVVAIHFLVARLDLDDDAVRIRSLAGTRVYPYASIADVKVERPSLAIRLAEGEWRQLPGWLGVNLSARRHIGRRISMPRAFRELEPSGAG